MGRSIRGAAVLAGAVALVAVSAPSAFGSTAQIVKASVNSSWTRGTFAGTVEWSGCAHGPKTVECAWVPYAAIATGNSSEACESSSRDALWEGQRQAAVGSQSFEVTEVPLDGSGGKVLCLGLIETIVEELPCMPPGEPIPPGWHCPYQTSSVDVPLASRVLDAPTEPDHPHGEPGEGEPPKPVTRECPRGRHRRHGHCVPPRHHRISLSQHRKAPAG